ncbi:MAG: DUF4184 family protein [Acidobacteria bacterium]|nr:DUF4184 family protein [Acidobacteriota bacterium]
MPFTPYHFGPGLLVKSLLPRWFSMIGFIATQVLIDCETLYYLITRQYPIHRTFHTFAGSAVAALVLAGLLIGIAAASARYVGKGAVSPRLAATLGGEVSKAGLVVGCLVGGASHTLLDGIFHRDVWPFAPWHQGTPFFSIVGPGDLQLLCVAAGLIGVVVLGVRSWLLRRAG